MPIGSRELDEAHLRETDENRSRELDVLRNRLHEREIELEKYRDEIKRDQYNNQKKMETEFKERERSFIDREDYLTDRQQEFEEKISIKEKENHDLHLRLQHEIRDREQSLTIALEELEREKSRYEKEAREKIESTSQHYVSDALSSLETKEKDFHQKSRRWAIAGATSLAFGLIFFIALSAYSALYPPQHVTWEIIALYLTKGLVVVGLFAAFAKYSHGYSSAYMHESLKNADRRHAINFGKFYLEAYGASAEWSEVKQAFEHWNIAEKNAFSKQEKTDDVHSKSSLKNINEGLSEVIKTVKNFEVPK